MTVRIAFLGDTLLGGEGQQTLDRRGYAYALEGLAPLLADADLVVANHEGPLTSLDRAVDKLDTGRKRYWYRGLPEAACALADAGVRVVSLANNHILDFGSEGLSDTMHALDAAGIAHCGAGMDEAQARRPVFVTANGCRIGFLSLMQRYDLYVKEHLYASSTRPGPRRLRVSEAPADLAAMKGRADVRVALVHWGRNYRGLTARQRRLAAILREAGADLVIGHHPHVPQPIECAGRVPVLYSLGNGALGTPGRFHSGRPPYGLVATVDIETTGASRLQVTPILVDNSRVAFRPMPTWDDEARRLLWSLVSPTDGWRESPDGGLIALGLGGRAAARAW
jgi:poly-gamma-glutamate capsule biosynthesis protein CapA/YwtB (metallophosphatase superfamily)